MKSALRGPAQMKARPWHRLQRENPAEAHAMYEEDIAACRAWRIGAGLLPDEGGVLTHCNAGASGHLRLWNRSGSHPPRAVEQGSGFRSSPTRPGPFCKARRLTLGTDGRPHSTTVICGQHGPPA